MLISYTFIDFKLSSIIINPFFSSSFFSDSNVLSLYIYFLNIIPDDGVVLDIGANIGIMTVHLSKKLKNSFIYSFEPIPLNLLTLKRIIKWFQLA